jgi:hypothetical protein
MIKMVEPEVVESHLVPPESQSGGKPYSENSESKSEDTGDEVIVQDSAHWLTSVEKCAYNMFMEKSSKEGGGPLPISLPKRNGLFALFLNGKTLDEIWKLNPNLGFGQIVYTAIEDNWYVARQAHLDTMIQRSKIRAVQATAESLELAADIIAALRKEHGDNIAKYLHTGNLKDLGDSTSGPLIRKLKDIGELLGKLTGGDQVRSLKFEGKVDHTGSLSVIPAQQVGKLSQWAQEKKLKELKKIEPKK